MKRGFEQVIFTAGSESDCVLIGTVGEKTFHASEGVQGI